MKFSDADQFFNVIKPLERQELLELGLQPEQDNKFNLSSLDMLIEVCRKNSQFHIATETRDGDDHDVQGEFNYTVSNKIRTVNRERFFLCKGDKNPELFLQETNYYR